MAARRDVCIALAAGLLVGTNTVPAAQISIPSMNASAGGTTAVEVQYSAQGARVAAIQFDLAYDPSLTVTAEIGRAGLAAGKFLSSGEVELGKRRFLLVGLNQLEIGDGALVTLTVTVPPAFVGTLVQPRLSNSLGADRDAMPIQISTVDGATQPGAGGAVGEGVAGAALRYVPLTSCRLMETRTQYNFEGRNGAFGPPTLIPGEIRTINPKTSNVCGIPQAAKAYILNITVIPHGSLNSVTVWPAGEPQPNVWTIRSPDGNMVANAAIVKAGVDDSISVKATDSTDILLDVNGYFVDKVQLSNLAYFPLSPCRVLDTRSQYRSPIGPFGPPSLIAQVVRTIQMPASPHCAVPTEAKAYFVTLTGVPMGDLQFITAWPSGRPQPNVSSISSPLGRVLANSVVIPAGDDGKIDVYSFNSTDLLIDINGYFAADDGVNGLLYFPVTQCRISDSTVTGGAFEDETARSIAVPTAGGCSGVPANAKGYALNVTALSGGSPMPFITVYPTGQPRPNASILNAFEGQIVTNSAIVPAGIGGAIDVYAYRRTHVVVEISGYFGR